MAHLIVEVSDHVAQSLSLTDICDQLQAAMVECAIFPVAGIRVRAYQPVASAIADLDPHNGFIAMTMVVGHGRTKAELAAAGDVVFTRAKANLGAWLADGYFALSLEIREIDPDLTWKANTIRPRMLAQTGKKD